LGPFLASPEELSDPSNLKMWLKVNGEIRQKSSTANMIFDVATLLSYVSEFMTLLPGDVISTGTPAGVGLGMKPPQYLKSGDVVELGIEGLGESRQRVMNFSEQHCYSGIGPEYNNPAWNGVENWGPTPAGPRNIGKGRNGGHTGPMSLPLTPRPGNSVLDPAFSHRDPGSFFWHGPNRHEPAGNSSNGCPVTDPGSRNTVNALGGGTLDVTPTAQCLPSGLAGRKNHPCRGGCTPKP